MINKLTLIGRAGKDARVGVTQKGTHYASVSLASGSKENTVWFLCSKGGMLPKVTKEHQIVLKVIRKYAVR